VFGKHLPASIRTDAILCFCMSAKNRRFLWKMLLLCIGLPIGLLVAGLASSAAQDKTITGYITCSVCAAKGATPSHLDCMEKCLAKGARVVIVLDEDQRIVPIENPDSVSRHHAHRVALFGYMNNNNNAFHVVSVRTL
jgi:hypothetical protein